MRMKTLRIPEGTWRPDDASLYHFGDYRIPQDMSEDMAKRAVAEGVGSIVEDKRADPAPETKAADTKATKAKARRAEH